MAESTAKIGFGLQFKIGDGASPEVFTALAEVTSLGGPSIGQDAIELTHTDSPNRFREFTPGLSDGGEFTLGLNLLKGNATILDSEAGASATKNYQVTFPTDTTTTWAFTGFMTAFNGDEPIGDRMTATATFKVTGKPVLS